MRVALSWSGGKDCALALWTLREEHGVEPVALLTTVDEADGSVSHHGIASHDLRRQAASTGIPLVELALPSPCPDDVYAERMQAVLDTPPLAAADTFAFGDLFLEDIRAYREERLGAAGRRALFPLWGRDTAGLARRFIDLGFRATIVAVDEQQLHPSFVGRAYDHQLLADLPPHVDPCGERGEFHTFAYEGPVFAKPSTQYQPERPSSFSSTSHSRSTSSAVV